MSYPNPNDGLTEPVNPNVPLEPIPGEPAPWTGEPRYGQYARGGQPVEPVYVGYGAPPPAPPVFHTSRPGIIPLRPLNLGDIFAGAWNAIKANPAVMIGLPLLIIAIASLLGALIGWGLNSLIAPWVNDLVRQGWNLSVNTGGVWNDSVTTTWDTTAGPTFGMGLTALLSGPIVTGILTSAISQSVLGNRFTARDIWERVRPRIGALLGWTFLSILIVAAAVALSALLIGLMAAGLGTAAGAAGALLVVPLAIALSLAFIWLIVKLIFVPVAIVLENASIGEAVRRSWSLTSGLFWRVFGTYLLANILLGLITSLITTPFTVLRAGALLGGGAGVATGFARSVLLPVLASIITTAITSIFMAGVLSLLYIDARMRKEGLADALAASANTQG